MSIETQADVEALKRVGAVVAEARDAMGRAVAPGVTTSDLDEIGRDVLEKHGARSAPQLAYRFPRATCISVNDEIAHGIPGTRALREGDLVNIDVSAELDGYFADTGASFACGAIDVRSKDLLRATRKALADAMDVARAGARLCEIGRAVEKRARRHGFAVVRNICGHGVGRAIHEPPSVPNTYDPRDSERLAEGTVITIEPFLTTGSTRVVEDRDGWTLRTPDGSRGAQFEHTLIVTRAEPIVVT